MKRLRDTLRAVGPLSHGFTIRLVILPLVFVLVPLIVYGQLRDADARKTQLLHDTVVQQDQLVVEVLRPYLEKFGRDQPQDLQNLLIRLGKNGTHIKLLFRPDAAASSGFFYIASAPPLSASDLERERKELVKLGAFRQLDNSCRAGSTNPVTRFTNPAGLEEMLTSLATVSTPTGCWAVFTSRTGQTFLKAARDKPFWQTKEMQLALAIYVFSALLIAWLFSTFWRNMALFRAAARKIRLRGSAGPSFVETNRIPELSGVAEDFDALVAALLDSKAQMQRAAEENAHALKAPLAVIAQSLEPLKAALPQDRAAAQRSLSLIERSVDKLDALVSAGRDLDQASAEAVFPQRWRVNLSESVRKLLLSYEKTLEANAKRLTMQIAPDLHVMASEDLIELVIENILDNAASFTPRDGTIAVTLTRVRDMAELTISDEGPGVEPEFLERIFDRYVSHRPTGAVQNRAMGADHFGLGLWIVRRNVEGAGGTVRAALRTPHGLAVTVKFPLTR